MKERTDDGGAAFPYLIYGPVSEELCNHGMSLRDWFAGMALNGTLARVSTSQAAILAYEYADAMLAERNKKR